MVDCSTDEVVVRCGVQEVNELNLGKLNVDDLTWHHYIPNM